MNAQTNISFSEYRKAYFLKLKDVAYLLDMDQANLSRFEAGKSKNPKILLGYQILFDLPKKKTTTPLFTLDYEAVKHRCFQLIEKLENKSQLHIHSRRINGIHKLISKLTEHTD